MFFSSFIWKLSLVWSMIGKDFSPILCVFHLLYRYLFILWRNFVISHCSICRHSGPVPVQLKLYSESSCLPQYLENYSWKFCQEMSVFQIINYALWYLLNRIFWKLTKDKSKFTLLQIYILKFSSTIWWIGFIYSKVFLSPLY